MIKFLRCFFGRIHRDKFESKEGVRKFPRQSVIAISLHALWPVKSELGLLSKVKSWKVVPPSTNGYSFIKKNLPKPYRGLNFGVGMALNLQLLNSGKADLHVCMIASYLPEMGI